MCTTFQPESDICCSLHHSVRRTEIHDTRSHDRNQSAKHEERPYLRWNTELLVSLSHYLLQGPCRSLHILCPPLLLSSPHPFTQDKKTVLLEKRKEALRCDAVSSRCPLPSPWIVKKYSKGFKGNQSVWIHPPGQCGRAGGCWIKHRSRLQEAWAGWRHHADRCPPALETGIGLLCSRCYQSLLCHCAE